MAGIGPRPRLPKARRRRRRRRQTRKTRAVRRQLHRRHDQRPGPARAWLDVLGGAPRRATAPRFGLLPAAALLAAGRHTVTNLLRTPGPLVPGDPPSYRRVSSRRRRPSWRLAKLLAGWAAGHLLPDGPISSAAGDTVDEHRGKRVYGKGRHRDPVRPTHGYAACRRGRKWPVVAVLVRSPFTRRPWALPVLVALYRSEEENRRRGRRHKTPPQLLRQLLRVPLRRFPERQFVCAADGNFATHDLARLAPRYPGRLTYLSHFYAGANLYEPAPPVVGKRPPGRPRKKGRKLPAPAGVVKQAQHRRRLNVAWYGGGRRAVEVVSGTAHRYEAGASPVAVLWVWAHDGTGTRRDEYFFTTDVGRSAAQVIETYTGRWDLGTTFQEMRSYLGLGTTCGWTERTALRVAPCLFGLYTAVVALYVPLPARRRGVRLLAWAGKEGVTFSGALTAVRRWLWVDWVFAIPGHSTAFPKPSRPFQHLLRAGLAPAA